MLVVYLTYKGYKNKKSRKEYLKEYMREYRARGKKKQEQRQTLEYAKKLFEQHVLGKSTIETTLEQKLENAKDSIDQLLKIYREHVMKLNDIMNIPVEQRFPPYYIWVHERDRIIDAILNINSTPEKVFLEKVKQHV